MLCMSNNANEQSATSFANLRKASVAWVMLCYCMV